MSFEEHEEEPGTSELPLMDEVEDKRCQICGDKSDGTHFGAESCRACAAFFRRTIVSGKQYICRHSGPGTCEISKSVRCMCRRCRFEKCHQVGMRKDMVQGRRDPIIPKSQDPQPLCATRKSTKSPEEKSSPYMTMEPSTSYPMNIYENIKIEEEEPVLLRRIFENYRHLCSIRRITELNLDENYAARVNSYGPLTGYVLGNSTKLSIYYKAHMPAIWEFISKSFDEFCTLDHDDKWSLFQSFMVNLWGMDNNYHTFKKIPREQFQTVVILSETMYFDVNRIEEFISDVHHASSPLRAELENLLRRCMTKQKQSVLFMMSDMQIEEEEYAALIALMLWNTNFENRDDRMDFLKKQMREKIFHQLHIYYRSKRIPQYAQRLGELMGLHSTVLVDVLRFREDMELFNLLEAFQKDNFFYEMVRNTKCY